MGLPIGMALFGLALGISSMSLVAYLIDIPSWAPVIGSMVGLGVGIDYALFVVTRHREYLAPGMTVRVGRPRGRHRRPAGGLRRWHGRGGDPRPGRGRRPVHDGGRDRHLRRRADHGGRFGDAAAGLPRPGRAPDQPAPAPAAGPRSDRPPWTRLAALGRARVAAPWPTRSAGHVLLLALAAPVLALRVGHPRRRHPAGDRTERRAYDLVAEGFGPGINGPLVIAVDIAGDPTRPRRARDGGRGGPRASPPSRPREVDPDGRVATLVAYPTTGPQDEATHDTIDRLRADVFPPCSAAAPRGAHRGADRDLRRRRRARRRPAAASSSRPWSCCRSCC